MVKNSLARDYFYLYNDTTPAKMRPGIIRAKSGELFFLVFEYIDEPSHGLLCS